MHFLKPLYNSMNYCKYLIQKNDTRILYPTTHMSFCQVFTVLHTEITVPQQRDVVFDMLLMKCTLYVQMG